MDITIVIPVYNRKALLKHTIDSIMRSPWAAAPVIVVDNGSTDGTDKFESKSYTAAGQTTPLKIEISEDAWKTTVAGAYSDTNTFTIVYVPAS